MNRIELPEESGAYRWWYVDVTSGDFTAVIIFMVGSVFSSRYSKALARGGRPEEHAAVNFALYEKGKRRQWILTEFDRAHVSDDRRGLYLGDSWLSYGPNGLRAEIRDQTTPFMVTQWGSPATVSLELVPEGPTLPEQRLVDGLDHFWRPIAARSHAKLTIAELGLTLEGRAYHDGNHGRVALGSDLPGWDWVRLHGPKATDIVYRPNGGAPATLVRVDGQSAQCERDDVPASCVSKTGWGLQVPSYPGVEGPPALLESSPFYARAEWARGDQHALGEAADFARFHKPSVRWMASFKTRSA